MSKEHQPWCASVPREFDVKLGRGSYPCDCKQAPADWRADPRWDAIKADQPAPATAGEWEWTQFVNDAERYRKDFTLRHSPMLKDLFINVISAAIAAEREKRINGAFTESEMGLATEVTQLREQLATAERQIREIQAERDVARGAFKNKVAELRDTEKQLATSAKAGQAAVEALEQLATQTVEPRCAAVANDALAKINEGK